MVFRTLSAHLLGLARIVRVLSVESVRVEIVAHTVAAPAIAGAGERLEADRVGPAHPQVRLFLQFAFFLEYSYWNWKASFFRIFLHFHFVNLFVSDEICFTTSTKRGMDLEINFLNQPFLKNKKIIQPWAWSKLAPLLPAMLSLTHKIPLTPLISISCWLPSLARSSNYLSHSLNVLDLRFEVPLAEEQWALTPILSAVSYPYPYPKPSLFPTNLGHRLNVLDLRLEVPLPEERRALDHADEDVWHHAARNHLNFRELKKGFVFNAQLTKCADLRAPSQNTHDDTWSFILVCSSRSFLGSRCWVIRFWEDLTAMPLPSQSEERTSRTFGSRPTWNSELSIISHSIFFKYSWVIAKVSNAKGSIFW